MKKINTIIEQPFPRQHLEQVEETMVLPLLCKDVKQKDMGLVEYKPQLILAKLHTFSLTLD